MKDIITIINEVIAEGIGDNDYYDLASAQRHYGHYVPWVLDNRDLAIIKRERAHYFADRDNMNPYDRRDSDKVSASWDDHIKVVTAALWRDAEKDKKG